MASRAEPVALPSGGTQLVRRWEASGPSWALVLIVHGLGEHSGRYERVGQQLATAGLSTHSFDLSGCGASSGRRADVESWSVYLDEVADRLLSLRSAGLPIVLFGHSMGGLIALEYVLSGRPAPDLLVLSAPGLGGGKRWQRVVAPILAKLVPTLRVPSAIEGEQLSRDPKVGEAYFTDPMVLTYATARFGAEIFAAMNRTKAGLAKLTVPTYVFHGGADSLVPPQISLPLADLPVVQRRVYPRLRHETFNEPEGQGVIEDMITWLRDRLTPSG